MVRLPKLRAFTVLLAAVAATGTVPGQPTSPVLSAPQNSSSDSSTDRPAPRRSRGISPEVAAQLQANTPKYAPAPPKPEPKPAEELPDLREIDKPKNTIIRLPQYIVREPTSPVLNERAVHTDKGLADLAVRRYISDADRALNRFTLPLFGRSVQERALAMYAEEERLHNMAELADNAAMVSTTDKAAGTYVKREAEKTYLRSSEFGWRGGNNR